MIKKIISVVLCIVIGISVPVTAGAASERITVNEAYKICIGSDTKLSSAADFLNRYIKEICGFSLEVSAAESSANGFILLRINPEMKNGCTITSDTENIFISGSSLRNTVDGICRFLERYGGVKYFTAETIVKASEISVPVNENYTYTPYFEMTETDWHSPKDIDYSLFNGLTGTQYRQISDSLGGGAEYISGFAHTFTNQFCSKDKYFESNPECFARCAGIKTENALCLSNPKTLEIVSSEVFELLKERHNPNADLQVISLTQNDVIYFCTCPQCLAEYAKYRSISGLLIKFINEIARRVDEAGYKNVAIDTFAYQYTRSAPHGIVPEKNVIVRLCSLECCFSHALNDGHCSANIGFAKDLQDWSKICDRLYVWDYVTNFCHYIGIFPNFNVLQKNIQFFYENNVKGLYEEGNYSMSECDSEFGELRAYLLCKLMQNPYCDLKAERSEFLDNYYGKGGKYIGEFIDVISESATKNHMSIYSSMSTTCSLSSREISKCDSLWKSAKNEADGIELSHIKDSELAWRYWKSCNNASEFKNIFTRKELKSKFDEDLAATSVKTYRECSETKAFFLGILQTVRFVLQDIIYPVTYLLNKL